jgi:hypothetical protein
MNARTIRNLAALAVMAGWLMFSPPKASASCNVPCEDGCIIDKNDCIVGCYQLPPLQQSACIGQCQVQYNGCLRACGC